MPEPTTSGAATPQRAPDMGYIIQRKWLDRAKGKPIQVRLLDGKVLKGELIGHDNYCLSLKLEAAPEPVLLFKHAIAYTSVLASGERNAESGS
jgi:sRNA-binding regulator protein Hfq